MIIDEKKVTVREIFENYENNEEEGVTGYDGRLDIRPKYQREFVYDDKKRDEVIRSILKDRPLNVFYWAKTGEDSYEVLDGQQRTISICEYVDGTYSVDDKYFDNQPRDLKEKILNYDLFVYVCDGADSEKLEWFKIINIAGVQLSEQELRNAVYAGPWVTDAKRYFSKSNSPASRLAEGYVNGKVNRQEVLESALDWMSKNEGKTIESYMSEHQFDQNAVSLWNYFTSVINWVQSVFPKKRSEMKGLPWGLYYNKHKDRTDLNPKELEEKIQELIADDDVTKTSGIYDYLLTGNEKSLNIRKFQERDKKAVYEKQKHKCNLCGKEFEYSKMDADHIIPWSKGGQTVKSNLQLLCRECNIKKSNK